VTPEIAARLAACEILMATQAKDYCLFVRGNCLALVHTVEDRFTSVGSTGLLTENGLAYLIWVDGKAILSSHGNQVEADAAQIETIRAFSEDLKKTIWSQMNTDEHR
jgi:hypothetical protein